MKLLSVIVLGLVLSGSVYASGKLQAEMRVYPKMESQAKPLLGLSVYENLFKKLYLNSWLGYGDAPITSQDSTKWATAKAMLEIELAPKLTMGIGGGTSYVFDFSEWHHYASLKMQYKLW